MLVFSTTFLPRSLVKKPLARPTSAGSWVMFARKPSRSVTGPEPEPEAPVAADEQPAARRVTAATPAASSTRLIKIHLSRSIYYPDQLSREPDEAQPDPAKRTRSETFAQATGRTFAAS